MNTKVFSVIEILLSAILVAVGFTISLNIHSVDDYIAWVMIGFFVIKILLALFRQLTFKISKVYTITLIALNVIAIILMIIFNSQSTIMAYVVGSSCIADLLSNFVKTIRFRKGRDNYSFFGMDNIICALFILLIFSSDKTIITASVLFGCLVLYKGISNILSNMFVKSLVSLTDLGKALNKVHALDVFFGLFVVLMLASFIFPQVEDSITTVGDAWWYSFALITTIGFGDVVATSVTGRILSVIIGFYGIIIVSLLTSSIVVYITEENKKNEKDKITDQFIVETTPSDMKVIETIEPEKPVEKPKKKKQPSKPKTNKGTKEAK